MLDCAHSSLIDHISLSKPPVCSVPILHALRSQGGLGLGFAWGEQSLRLPMLALRHLLARCSLAEAPAAAAAVQACCSGRLVPQLGAQLSTAAGAEGECWPLAASVLRVAGPAGVQAAERVPPDMPDMPVQQQRRPTRTCWWRSPGRRRGGEQPRSFERWAWRLPIVQYGHLAKAQRGCLASCLWPAALAGLPCLHQEILYAAGGADAGGAVLATGPRGDAAHV